MNFQLLLQIFGVTSIIITGGAWLLNKLAEQFFQNQAESFKIKLEHEATIKAQEHNVKFTRYDEDISCFLKEIYADMFKLYIHLVRCNNINQEQDLFSNIVNDIIVSIHHKISVNAIMLNDELWELLENFSEAAGRIHDDIVSQRINLDNNAYFTKKDEIAREIAKLKNEVLYKIKVEFRSILSV